MYPAIVALGLCLFLGFSTQAQSQNTRSAQTSNSQPGSNPATQQPPSGSAHIDFTTVPATGHSPSLTTPNDQLLHPSGNGPAVPYSTVTDGSTPGTPVQQVNATSKQFNLGNKKATNTIYYDNSGKMTGSSTSIQLGK